MKYVFVGAFIAMLLLSVVAVLWVPEDELGGKTEIVWVSDDNPVRREQIALFNRLYPQYHLRIDPQNIGMEKTIVQCIAGVGPDVFDCYTGFQLGAFVRSGIARDCTEDFKRRGIDTDAIWPAVIPLCVHEGRAYGHADNAHAPALWFNKDIFEEVGLPHPDSDWTWEDFLEMGPKLMQYDGRGRPSRFAVMMSLTDWLEVLVPQWGGSVYNAEGTRCALDSPEAAGAAQFYQDLIYKHKLAPSPTQEDAMASAGGWGTGTIALFGAGKAAMAIGGRWWLCLLRREEFAGLRLGSVELPAGPSRRVYGGGRSTLVNAKGKNIEGALTFLEYMHGPHWNNLVNRQADALAPVMKYNYTEEFLHNPEHPEEDYNAVWRTAMEESTPREVSPFVNGQQVDRILIKQADLLRAELKSGAEAMRDAAKEINKAIIEQIGIDPELRERYYALVEQGAPPAWDDPEDAP